MLFAEEDVIFPRSIACIVKTIFELHALIPEAGILKISAVDKLINRKCTWRSSLMQEELSFSIKEKWSSVYLGMQRKFLQS